VQDKKKFLKVYKDNSCLIKLSHIKHESKCSAESILVLHSVLNSFTWSLILHFAFIRMCLFSFIVPIVP